MDRQVAYQPSPFSTRGAVDVDVAHHATSFFPDESREDLLQAIADPRDRSKRFRAWLTPFFGLSLSDLKACKDIPGDHPLLNRIVGWKALADTKEYEELFTRILEESGILRRELFLSDSERAITNYLHLFEILLAH